MTEQEIRLRCLELAIEQARREGATSFRETVADLATWFYNRTQPGDVPDAPQASSEAVSRRGRHPKAAADKSSTEIFA